MNYSIRSRLEELSKRDDPVVEIVVQNEGKIVGKIVALEAGIVRLSEVKYCGDTQARPGNEDFEIKQIVNVTCGRDELISQRPFGKKVMVQHMKPQHLQDMVIANSLEMVQSTGSHPTGLPVCEYHIINSVEGDPFKEAITHFSSLKALISVSAEGVLISRTGSISWLLIGTARTIPEQNEVYAFDIDAMGEEAFAGGLRFVLQDPDLQKIVHDCRLLSDCLFHKYNVTLTNVWDTQVAEIIVFKDKCDTLNSYVKSLRESLSDRCGIVLPTECYRADHMEEDQMCWQARPLPEKLEHLMVLKIQYLAMLRRVLTQKMMEPFTSCVDLMVETRRIESSDAIKEILENPHQLHREFVFEYNRAEERRRNAIERLPSAAHVDKRNGLREVVGRPIENGVRYGRDTWHWDKTLGGGGGHISTGPGQSDAAGKISESLGSAQIGGNSQSPPQGNLPPPKLENQVVRKAIGRGWKPN